MQDKSTGGTTDYILQRGPFIPSFRHLCPLPRLLVCQLPLPPHLPPLPGTVVSAILVVML